MNVDGLHARIKGLLLTAVLAAAAVNLSAARAPTVHGTHLMEKGDTSLRFFGISFFKEPPSAGYLAVGALPPIRVGLSGDEASSLSLTVDRAYMEPHPTLDGFLAYLEEEKKAEAAEREAAETAATEAAAESAEEEALAGDPSGQPGQSDASGTGTSLTLGGAPDGLVLRTTDPFSENYLFPRPDRNRLRRDWLQLYFPVDQVEDRDVGILIPMNYDAAFLPPGFEGMRSSATIRQEP